MKAGDHNRAIDWRQILRNHKSQTTPKRSSAPNVICYKWYLLIKKAQRLERESYMDISKDTLKEQAITLTPPCSEWQNSTKVG